MLAELGADHRWLETGRYTGPGELEGLDGIWCVPGSPYRSMEAALAMIRSAREAETPFLGTCGGFQHALLEHARNVAGIVRAEHAESSPSAAHLVIEPLSCSLVGAAGAIRPVPGTRLFAIYGQTPRVERYHCSYGLAPGYRHLAESDGMRVAALDDQGETRAVERDDQGETRAVERDGRWFWLATLFQPELSSPAGRPHPVIAEFVAAARAPYTS